MKKIHLFLIFLSLIITTKPMDKPLDCQNFTYLQSAQYSPDGRFILTLSGTEGRITGIFRSTDCCLRLWDAHTGRLIYTIEHPTFNLIDKLQFSPNSAYIATKSEDHYVRILETKKGKLIHELKHDAPITSFTFSPEITHILTVSNGVAYVWHVETGFLMYKIEYEDMVTYGQYFPLEMYIRTATYSADGKFILTTSNGMISSLHIWDAQTGARVPFKTEKLD